MLKIWHLKNEQGESVPLIHYGNNTVAFLSDDQYCFQSPEAALASLALWGYMEKFGNETEAARSVTPRLKAGVSAAK